LNFFRNSCWCEEGEEIVTHDVEGGGHNDKRALQEELLPSNKSIINSTMMMRIDEQRGQVLIHALQFSESQAKNPFLLALF
jgi:hypothetical protein